MSGFKSLDDLRCLRCGKRWTPPAAGVKPASWWVVIEKGRQVGDLCPTCGKQQKASS